MNAIINGKILTPNNILYNKVLLFNEKVVDIIDEEQFNYCNITSNLNIIDAQGNYVSPGFIDLHIHGSGGHDVMDGNLEGLKKISECIAENGVTSFLPTTMTMRQDVICKALDNIQNCMNSNIQGAKILGAHLEGPFINRKYKGAQNEEYIIKPDYSFVEKYKDIIKIITLAPEQDENFKFIKQIKEHTQIVLSIGHSNATYEEAMEAIKMGVSNSTHTFNGMTPLHHRDPGIIGAAFNSDIYCEVIADTIHIHPAVFNILVNIKGEDRLLLVTDCMRAGCIKAGISELGGQKVIIKDNSARLESGSLAGSILRMNKAVKNFIDNTNLEIYEVVKMASLNQAINLGIDNETGSIETGKDADIIIFDNEINIKKTIINGKTIFEI